MRFGLLVKALALCGLTAFAAGYITPQSVRLEFGSLHGLWHLRYWGPATPDEPWAVRLVSPRRTPANARLSLPLQLVAAPMSMSVKAWIDVRSDWLVHACHRRVGKIPLPAGEWGEFRLDVADAATGCPLDIALALAPRPLARGSPADQPKLLVEALEIEAPRGLRLTLGARGVVGALPLAVFAIASLLGLGGGRGLALAGGAAVAGLLGVRLAPLGVLVWGPLASAVALVAAGSVRFDLVGWVGRSLSKPYATLDGLLMGGEVDANLHPRPSTPWASVALIALTPGAITSALLAAFFGKTLLDHVPASINDAIDYWLETAAFTHAGFGGGYFTFDERPAPASIFHFGSHGPIFPMLYGTIGRFVGWRPYSGPLFHLAFVTAAFVWYLRDCRLDYRQRGLVTLCLASFWPLMLFLPTNMQEGFHFALAVALATALHPVLQDRLPGPMQRSIAFCILMLAALIRPSWGILLPVLVLRCGPSVLRKRKVLGVTVAGALFLGVLLAFSYTAAPMAGKPFLFLRAAMLQEPSLDLIDYGWTNLKRLLFTGARLERWGGLLAMGFAALCVALSTVKAHRATTWFHAYNLGVIVFAVFATYPVSGWGAYRVLGPHLLLTSVLLVASPQPLARRLAALVVLAHLAATGAFLQAFQGLAREPYTLDHRRIADFARLARETIAFRPGHDPWCNTLVATQYPFFFPEMAGLPPGLGVTMLFPPSEGLRGPRPNLRSNYVLLDVRKPLYGGTPVVMKADGPEQLQVTFGDWMSLNLRLLAETPIGGLYRNLDARCPAD